MGLTYKLAADWAAEPGIRVNAIVPGYFPSDLGSGQTPDEQTPDERNTGIASHVPMRREGGPGECAAAVVLLASDAASYISGAVFEVDGGLLARRRSASV